MGKKKLAYVVRLKFPSYESRPFRAELTSSQAGQIGTILDKHKKSGSLVDFYLGPPDKIEQVHALVLSADALKAELLDLIGVEKRLSEDRGLPSG
jgi:hypothetical protein